MSPLDHPVVERFDAWADAQIERLRGHPIPDRVFVAASELGDFSLIWHLTGAARGITSIEHANQAFVFSALIGAESQSRAARACIQPPSFQTCAATGATQQADAGRRSNANA